MVDFFNLEQAEFEALFQEFVLDGGLDSTHVVNEDYERAHKESLCKHHKPYKACELCYRSLPPYFPTGS